ncbi:MAG: DUF1304 domain-containing protein [Bdellovibrionota bacterium]
MFVNLIIASVAVLHLNFLILEMFFWTKPWGLRVFRQSKDHARATAVLAANQGLYNGFLAAGLIWGLIKADPTLSLQIKLFFLSCVSVAGIYGAITVNKRIFFMQALPALCAIVGLRFF